MKKIIFILLVCVVTAFAVLTMSGCLIKTVDELYSFPQLSEGYLQLQTELNKIMSTGAQYSAPSSGQHRQAVQFDDIDGDGSMEALAFFSKAGDDNPLKIYVFDIVDGMYQNKTVIEGKGTNIESVHYADLDGDGEKEIAVGWQMSADMKMLTIYSLKDFTVTPLMSTDYTEYTFYNLTGNENVIVFRVNAAEGISEAELFVETEEKEIVSSKVPLTSGITALSRIRCNSVRVGKNAVYVESVLNEGIVTDILVYNNGFMNITLDESGVSSGTIRSQSVYCRDIDGNGMLDVPNLVPLPQQTDTVYYLTQWFTYNYIGGGSLLQTTYHNYSDGWYLKIPEDWIDKITVRREDGSSGERAIVFSYLRPDGETTIDFLVIYAISGESRYERAAVDGRFTLLEAESTVYAAKTLQSAGVFGMTLNEDTIKNNIGIIYSEWITGEL